MECDVWSLGVIMFILLAGEPPFIGENPKDVFWKIKNTDFSFSQKVWSKISSEAKDLIR
jgi:calcium-dependent protein kinase